MTISRVSYAEKVIASIRETDGLFRILAWLPVDFLPQSGIGIGVV
jgi:hypothetical protein